MKIPYCLLGVFLFGMVAEVSGRPWWKRKMTDEELRDREERKRDKKMLKTLIRELEISRAPDDPVYSARPEHNIISDIRLLILKRPSLYEHILRISDAELWLDEMTKEEIAELRHLVRECPSLMKILLREIGANDLLQTCETKQARLIRAMRIVNKECPSLYDRILVFMLVFAEKRL